MTLVMSAFSESRCLGRQRKLGGILRLKLPILLSPIANKYREGKVQSTLERELNVPETVVMQAYGTCAWLRDGKCLSSVLRVVAEWLPLGSVPVEHPPFISWQLSTRVCARSNVLHRFCSGGSLGLLTGHGLRL